MLGTSALSFFFRGDPQVVELIEHADWLGLPATTLGELQTGFLLGRRLEENRELLRQFSENPVVERIDVDDRVAEVYAEIVVSLRRAGTPVPTNDIWIAAAASATGSSVLTYDAHFQRMPQSRASILPQPQRLS
ncbi:MAG: PIN domain-containing protein [Acidobacteriota bacterium]|nr:PIN domain-containing protein [Acidobacteriota bacterium]